MEDRPISVLSFKKFLDEGKLMGSRCKQCGALFTPPRPICYECHSTDMEWHEMKGKGKLATFTSIYIGPPWMIAQGFDRTHPYASAVVDLEEGTRIDARLTGVDADKPDTIKLGMPLTVDFIKVGEGEEQQTFLAFKPE